MALSPQENSGFGPSKAKLIADINITPMVDVMLVLLVIFMVTAPLLIAGVHVDLPKNKAPKLSHLQKPVIVSLTENGDVYVGEDRVEETALSHRLQALKAKEGDAVVYLRADRKIAYGEVLQLLGRVGDAGFQHVSLISLTNTTAPALPARPEAGQ